MHDSLMLEYSLCIRHIVYLIILMIIDYLEVFNYHFFYECTNRFNFQILMHVLIQRIFSIFTIEPKEFVLSYLQFIVVFCTLRVEFLSSRGYKRIRFHIAR